MIVQFALEGAVNPDETPQPKPSFREQWEAEINKALQAQGWPCYRELQKMSAIARLNLEAKLKKENRRSKTLYQIEHETRVKIVRAERARRAKEDTQGTKTT